MIDTKTATNYLMRKGFAIDKNGFIVGSNGIPIVICIHCGKIYNDKYTRPSRTGAHCPYCGSPETAELETDDIEWFASTLSADSRELGRLT